MSRTRTWRRGVGAIAAAGLAAATLTVLSAPAHAAAASIQIDTVGNIGDGQTIQVSGNNGAPSSSAPDLYIAVCETTPNASNCDQSINGIGSPGAHILQVNPDDVTGAWSGSFFVRTTIKTGNTPGGFNCIAAGTCVIGSTNSANPADHTYDAITPLTPLGPKVTLSSSSGVDGDVISVTGSGFKTATAPDGTSPITPIPVTYLNQQVNITTCGFPPTATSCNGNFSQYASGNIDHSGHLPSTNLTLHFPFTDMGSVVRTCTAANSCIVGTSNAVSPADQTFSAGAVIQNIPAPTATIYSIAGSTTNTSTARNGQQIILSGGNWTPSTSGGSAQICDSAGANCGSADVTNDGTGSGGTGTLLSGITLNTVGAGVHKIKVTLGTQSALSGPFTLLGAPTIALNPTGGGAGTSVTVSGSNWDPGSTVTLQGKAGASNSGDAAVTATANASGSFTATYPVNDVATTAIDATSGTLSASAPFGASGDECPVPDGGQCSLQQNVHFLANPGVLKQSQAGSDIDLGAITLDGTEQHVTGTVNEDTVTDARGTSAGWTLNAKLTDLKNGATPTTNGIILATNMAWTPACVATSGGATPTSGSSATLSNSDQLFCSVPSGTGNGIYTADAGLDLTVPATADAGTYNAILTLTLS